MICSWDVTCQLKQCKWNFQNLHQSLWLHLKLNEKAAEVQGLENSTCMPNTLQWVDHDVTSTLNQVYHKLEFCHHCSTQREPARLCRAASTCTKKCLLAWTLKQHRLILSTVHLQKATLICEHIMSFFPKQAYLYRVLTPFKGLHPWAAWFSHSGCLGPHEFTLVSPLSPTLRALGRMSLHLSPPCLPLWVPGLQRLKWRWTCNEQVPPVFFACKLNLYSCFGKLKIFDMQQTGSSSFLPASWICTATMESWKYLTCNKQVPTVFCTATVENWKYLTCNKQVPTVFLPASWICTATVENWKYLTCNKQVPTVPFFLQVESVLLLWKTESIWHATNKPVESGITAALIWWWFFAWVAAFIARPAPPGFEQWQKKTPSKMETN